MHKSRHIVQLWAKYNMAHQVVASFVFFVFFSFRSVGKASANKHEGFRKSIICKGRLHISALPATLR